MNNCLPLAPNILLSPKTDGRPQTQCLAVLARTLFGGDAHRIAINLTPGFITTDYAKHVNSGSVH